MNRFASVLRILIAVLLLVTSIGKLLDLRGFALIVGNYQVLPPWAWLPAGTVLTLAELGLAIWLFSRWHLFEAACVALLMHLSYMTWAAVALLRGLSIENCGCFGVFLARPLNWMTVIEDAVVSLLCLVLVVYFRPRASG